MITITEKVICEDINNGRTVVVEKGRMYYVYTTNATMLLKFERMICETMEFQIQGDAFQEEYFTNEKNLGINCNKIERIEEYKFAKNKKREDA